MSDIISYLKNSSQFVITISLAVFVGGVTTNFVRAGIPDSSGQIYGCYRTNGGDLRVIDNANPSDVCSNKETSISWDNGGSNSIGGFISLAGIEVVGLDLSYRNFNNGDFLGTQFVSSTKLNNSDFSNAVLVDSYISASNINNAVFINANLTNANIATSSQDINFSGASLVNSTISGSMQTSNFTNADLSNSNLTGLVLNGSIFTNTNFTNAFFGADVLGSDLSTANLSGVTWGDIVCPDGTSAQYDNSGTCIGHLVP